MTKRLLPIYQYMLKLWCLHMDIYISSNRCCSGFCSCIFQATLLIQCVANICSHVGYLCIITDCISIVQLRLQCTFDTNVCVCTVMYPNGIAIGISPELFVTYFILVHRSSSQCLIDLVDYFY